MLPAIRKVSTALLALIVIAFAYLIAPIALGSVTAVSAASLGQTTPQNLQLIDRLGGATTNVAVNGQYAYIIVSDRLIILDISNPATPLTLGNLALSYPVNKMVVANEFLYLFSSGYAGVHIISVSDPLYPVEVGTFWPGDQYEFAAQSHFIYVTTHDGSNEALHIVDVAKPTSPLEVGNYTYPGEIVRLAPNVAVQGNYAYVLGVWLRELRVVDISDPTNPREVSSVHMPTSFVGTLARTSLTILGQTAYASYTDDMPDHQSRFDGLALVDISNPLAPKLQGQIASSRVVYPQGNIATSNNYLYWGRSNAIDVINVADHENPFLEKTLDFNSSLLTSVDNRLYNASPDRGLQIFDLSTPLTPTLLSSNSNDSLFGDFSEVLIRDNHLYATGGSAMKVVDLSAPKAMASSLFITGTLFAFDDHYAYLAWFVPNSELGDCTGFNAVDITNPISPTLALTYQLGCRESGSYAPIRLQAITNHRLYASSADTLYVYALATPGEPTLLSTYAPLESGTMIVKGNYAYVAKGQPGITILDVSGTTTPTLIANYPAIDPVYRFALTDHYLLAASLSELQILELINPATPVKVGSIPLGYEISGVVADNSYIYVTDPNRGVRVFDIANPFQPSEVANYPATNIQGLNRMALHSDHKLYVGYGANGLALLQLVGRISGKVVDSFGKPHAGVKVTLSDGQSTQTNAQGDYSFTSLTPGSYTVKVESSTYDFQPSERTLRAPSYASDAINFTLLLKPLSTTVTSDSPTHLSYTDLVGNLLAFDLPAGVVTQATAVNILPQASAAAPGQFFTGVRFDLQTGEVRGSSSNFTFTAPLTITIHYTDSAVAPVTDMNQLMLRWWDGSGWVDATTTCSSATPVLHNLASQVLTTTVCQSGQFALFGPTVQHFLPLVSRSQVATSEMRGRFVAQHSGKCLNVLAESQQNWASIIQWPCVGGDNEIWSIRPQGEYVQLAAKHSQKCLNVSNASQAEGAQVIQYSCSGGDNELWRLLPVDDDLYQIVAKHSNQCLTVQDASQEDKAQVIQSTCSESPNQIWRFQAAN